MSESELPILTSPGYRHGDWVEVRSLKEILATLDADGKRNGIPFMPEMARYCGCRVKVFRRAEKTCVEGAGMRSLGGAVLLEGLRCDGAMHDGCQRGCLYFWREEWLKPCRPHRPSAAPRDGSPTVSGGAIDPRGAVGANDSPAAPRSAQESPALMLPLLPTKKDGRYYCQSTELLGATQVFPRWTLRHYVRDFRTGQGPLPKLVRILWRVAINKIRRLFGLDQYGLVHGHDNKPSKGDLDLAEGEWVEVKSREEILATLDRNGRNRGLSFEIEMFDHCGRRHQVAYPIRKIILEETGKMVELTNTVVLKDVVCKGMCAKNCPRTNFLYWREIWLRRVEPIRESAAPRQEGRSVEAEPALLESASARE